MFALYLFRTSFLLPSRGSQNPIKENLIQIQQARMEAGEAGRVHRSARSLKTDL